MAVLQSPTIRHLEQTRFLTETPIIILYVISAKCRWDYRITHNLIYLFTIVNILAPIQ